MRYSSSILAALASAPLLVSAIPVKSRAASANDALVFQFANILEQLETNFYAQGIAKFNDNDFTNAGFSSALIASQTLKAIQADEAAHTVFIQQGLTDNGAKPLNCSFDFSSVLTDVATMAAVARKVEFVGVSAYLGGATLLDDPVFLDAAASILTVEARHQTLLNILAGADPLPQAFDIPLKPQEVMAIAGGFLKDPCTSSDIGINATNTLTVTNSAPKVGDTLQFSGNGVQSSGQFCNMIVGGMPFAINLPIDQCVIPPGINGPVAVWITSDNNPLANNVVDRDPTKQIAGPDIIFVDSNPQAIGQLVRNTGNNGGGSSSSTTTITPDQAASISGSSSQSTDSGANGAAAAPASTPLPSNFVGQSPDGKTNVIGLSLVPAPPASSTDSASGSSTASSASATSTSS